MAKIDFFKTWEVYEIRWGTNGEVTAGSSVFCIYADSGDNVTIQYTGFASAYPTLQNGQYQPLGDNIVAYFLDSTYIELRFQVEKGAKNFDKLDVFIRSDLPALPHITEIPETGEWGAEACT